jgi:hypothetical protein
MPEVYRYAYYPDDGNLPSIRLATTPPMVRDVGVNVLDVERIEVTEEELATLRRLKLVDVTMKDILLPKLTEATAAEKETAGEGEKKADCSDPPVRDVIG